ncbi:MAG: hypothetical protein ACI8RL_001801, partial [Cyclobacteriaceae bacterium]
TIKLIFLTLDTALIFWPFFHQGKSGRVSLDQTEGPRALHYRSQTGMTIQ